MQPPTSKAILWFTLALWTLVLSCNGLIVAVALYSELVQPILFHGSDRPPVEKEFFVRDPQLGWRLQPHLDYALLDDATQQHVPYFTTGADGLRTTREKKANRLDPAIIMLGDSFVQGYFLYDDETIASRLEARTGLNTLNAGIGGFSTDQQFILLQQLLKTHAPSWVVVVFFPNDLPFLQSEKAWEMEKPIFEVVDGVININKIHPPPATRRDSLAPPFATRKVVDCCTYNFFDSVQDKIGQTYAALPAPGAVLDELQLQIARTKENEYHYQIRNPVFYTQPELYGPDWSLFFQFLLHMRLQGEREGYQLAVLYLPEIAQIAQADSNHFAPQHYFADRCGHLNIDCIEPHRAFIERQREVDLFFMDDGHLSPAGADLVAQILQEYIATH